MNAKKANWAFLITVIFYVAVSYAMALCFPELTESFAFSNLICELMVALPVLLLSVFSGERLPQFLRFKKVKGTTLLMTALFTLLAMPLVTLVNLISQLFVSNEVAAMMDAYGIGTMSFWQLMLPLAVAAPVFEETACRGVYYHAYRKSGRGAGAMLLSAAIFALMHMNLNQAAYAFVIGVLLVMLLEASGSIWTTILYHALVNGSQGLLMYALSRNNAQLFSQQTTSLITTDYLLYAIGVYLIMVAVTLPGAWGCLVWIENHEGRQGAIAGLFSSRKKAGGEGEDVKIKKDKLVTLPLILAVLFCFLVMSGALAEAVYAVVMKL